MIDPQIDSVDVSAYTLETDAPEADGTLSWDSTTMVLVEVSAGGAVGTGWTYGPVACATGSSPASSAGVTPSTSVPRSTRW